MTVPLCVTRKRWSNFICGVFFLTLMLSPTIAQAQFQDFENQSLFGDESTSKSFIDKNNHNKTNNATNRNVSFRRNDDQNVTIPMSTYQDLLDRVGSLESRVNATQGQSVPNIQNVFDQAASQSEPDPSQGGFYSRFEVVAIKPIFSNNPAFYISDVVASASSDSSLLQEFSWDLDDSYRFEFGYLNPSTNLGWRTRYWFFDTNAREVSPDDEDVRIGVADDPDIGIDDLSPNDNDFLIATASTKIDVLDVERFSKHGGYDDNIIFSGGLRYARINHAYSGLSIDPGNPVGFTTHLQTYHVFEGVGPTVSLTKRRPIPNSNFSVEVGGRGSIVFGSGDATWSQYRGGFTSSDAVVDLGQMRAVPVVELQMGVAYRRRTRRLGLLELSTGLEGQFWMNGGTPLEGGQNTAYDSDRITSPWTEDLFFLGTYFRGSVNY